MKYAGKLIRIQERVCLLIVVYWLNTGKRVTEKSVICKFYAKIIFSKNLADIHVKGSDSCDLELVWDVETDACELKLDVEQR